VVRMGPQSISSALPLLGFRATANLSKMTSER
jgi:hypothetical protein